MMNNYIYPVLFFWVANLTLAQPSSQPSKLFQEQEPIEIKISYSNKVLRKTTNDSTFIKADLTSKIDGKWQVLPVSLRARGNFRRKECYFSPVKIKIEKNNAEGTIFEGNKSLKLILPCKLESNKNDNIIQEYIAYKIFSKISPYHFNTRRVKIKFSEKKKKNIKEFDLEGFLIEDNSLVANRIGGRKLRTVIHPLGIDAENEIQSALFQFMIGNTDFSTSYQHNGKLLYVEKRIVHIPYDFDMSGLVNASYSVVNPSLNIDKVTERKYRGFKRPDSLFQLVRKQFLNKKPEIIEIINQLESEFDNVEEYNETKAFIESFYTIIENEKSFKEIVINAARTK